MTDKQLLELPLFQGMDTVDLSYARDEMPKVLSHTKRGMIIVDDGDKCDSLLYVTKGTVRCVTKSNDKSYRMEEVLHAPLLIEPDRLFGVSQRYSSQYVASTVCDTMEIPKAVVTMMMQRSMVFRINVMNLLSSMSQRRGRSVWYQQSEDILQRVVRFIKDHSIHPAGQKRLFIKMNTLARELGCSRLEVSQALHKLEEKEYIKLRRSIIEIPVVQVLF